MPRTSKTNPRGPGRAPAARPQSAIDLIIEALKEGRPIVPFLAAGISVNTGFPSLAAITQYLAKVRAYITCVYKDPYARSSSDTTPVSIASYLRQNGWPNLNRLNADIWRYSCNPDRALVGLTSSFVKVRHDLRDDEVSQPILEKLSARLADRNLVPQQLVDAHHLEQLDEQDRVLAQRVLEEIWLRRPGELYMRGDWYGLLMGMTEGNFDLIDELFVDLAAFRRPSATHVFLAHMVDMLRVRLFLTTNFDPFLETALREEGRAPAVYDVFRDADLPSPRVIRQRLSVLKLNGGVYGVRIGERIQESLDDATRQRALEIIPEDALVIVLGFSGGERRLMQLLESIARRGTHDRPSLLWMHWQDPLDQPVTVLRERLLKEGLTHRLETRVLDDAGSFLQGVLCRLGRDFPSGERPYPLLPTRPPARPGVWKELPPERVHLFVSDAAWSGGSAATSQAQGTSDGSVAMSRFCAGLQYHQYHPIWIDCEEHHTTEGVVSDILDQVMLRDPTFPPLLMQTSEPAGRAPRRPVDPEARRRQQGEQEGADTHQLSRAVEYIREALQRGRYVLCIDSPEAFGRPQTVHHGIPSLRSSTEERDDGQRRLFEGLRHQFRHRVSLLFEFLDLLLDLPPRPDPLLDIGESYIALALDVPTPRHTDSPTPGGSVPPHAAAPSPAMPIDFIREEIDRFVGILKRRTEDDAVRPARRHRRPDPDRNDHPADLDPTLEPSRIGELAQVLLKGGAITFAKDDVLLAVLLSFFRRPRSYLALRSVFVQVKKGQPGRESMLAIERGADGGVTLTVGSEDPASPARERVIDGGATTVVDPEDPPRPARERVTERIWRDMFTWLDESDQHPGTIGTRGERPIEGGLLWLARQNHNRAYNLLSDPIHLASRSDGGSPRAVASADVLVRLLLMAVVHRRSARYYYSDLYASSGDLAAYREYIYHRVSMLRTLARVSRILMREGGKDAWERMIGDVFGDGANADEETGTIFSDLGSESRPRSHQDDGAPRVEIASLLIALAQVRLRELQAFRATLSRESNHVLETTYAGTWLAWLERLRAFDCAEISEDLRSSEREQLEASRPDLFLPPGELYWKLELLRREVDALDRDLDAQEINFLEEKADWDGTLHALSKNIIETIKTIYNRRGERVRVRGRLYLQQLLNIRASAESFVEYLERLDELKSCPWWDSLAQLVEIALREPGRASRSPAGFRFESLPEKMRAAEFVDCCAQALKMVSDVGKAARILHHLGIGDHRARSSHRGIECSVLSGRLLRLADTILVRLREWLDILDTLDDAKATKYSTPIRVWLRRELDRTDLDSGFLRALAAFKHANPWLDSESDSPRQSGSRLYDGDRNQFLGDSRAKALALQETARRTVFEDRRIYNFHRARSLIVLARSNYLEGRHFERSLSFLRRAIRLLGGGGTAHALGRAGAFRARAECCMLQADQVLARAGERCRRREDWIDAFRSAENRLELARSNLAQTRHIIITERRRNVLWWLRLARDLAQWSIEAAILNVVRCLPSLSPPDRGAAPISDGWTGPIGRHRHGQFPVTNRKFESILIDGLSAIRAAMKSVLRTSDPAPDDVLSFSGSIINAAQEEWMRSAGQWLCLMAATYWYDALQYQPRIAADPDPRLACTDFPQLFRERWRIINTELRLQGLIEAIEPDLLLPSCLEVTGLATLAERGWAAESAPGGGPGRGWTDIRLGVLDSMKSITQNDKVINKLSNLYYLKSSSSSSYL